MSGMISCQVVTRDETSRYSCGPIQNYMALKLMASLDDLYHSFGPIQNYMALKLGCKNFQKRLSFGPIQNYMALKLISRRRCI